MDLLQKTNVSFTASGLPVIGDYGKLYVDQIVGLYKVASNAAKYTDDGGLSHDIIYAGTAVAAGLPTWAGGILTVPDANAVETGKYNRLALAAYDADLTKTFVVLVKGSGANTYLLHNVPVNVFINGATLRLIYNNGTTRQIDMQVLDTTVWSLVVITMDALGVYISVNGGTFLTHLFASTGGPAPTAATGTAYLGANSTAQGLIGSLAFVAQYERTVTQNEAVSLYRGIRRWAKDNKAISI